MTDRRSLLKAGIVAGFGALAGPAMPALREAHAQSGGGAFKWGGTLVVALDPHTLSVDVPTAFIRTNIYDALYECRGQPPEPHPSLAKDTKISEGGRVFDLTLHENVRFHDGTPLTAEDVVYSFRRMFALKRGATGILADFLKPNNVVATGSHAVRLTLEQPFAPFIATLPLVPIVNRALVERNARGGDWGEAWLSQNDAGSGPYKVVPGSFVSAQRIDLEWFPDYFRGWPSPAPIKLVQCRPPRDDATRILAIQKGDIDVTSGYVRPDQHERVRSMAGVRLSEEPTMRTFFLTFHNGRDPLSNVNLRKAISYAFPYDMFLNQMLRGANERNPGPLPVNIWGNPADLKGYTYDLALAEKHLKMAKDEGADINRELNFLALIAFDETEQAAQLLQSELRKIGVRMRISKTIWANVAGLLQSEDTTPDIWGHWNGTAYPDPDAWVGRAYLRSNLGSLMGSAWYRDDETERLLNLARTSTERAERTKLYEQISRRLVDQAVELWIYNGKLFRGVRQRVGGYAPASIGDGVEIRKMWLKD